MRSYCSRFLLIILFGLSADSAFAQTRKVPIPIPNRYTDPALRIRCAFENDEGCAAVRMEDGIACLATKQSTTFENVKADGKDPCPDTFRTVYKCVMTDDGNCELKQRQVTGSMTGVVKAG